MHKVHIRRVLHVIDADDMDSVVVAKHELMSVIDSIIKGELSGNEAVQVLKAYAGDIAEVYEAVMDKTIIGAADKKVFNDMNALKIMKVVNSGNNMRIFMHDSASSTHLITSEHQVIPGTLSDCNVIISGVNGESKIETLHARKRGDVRYDINDNEHIILRGALIAENAKIGDDAEADGDYVLVSTSKLTSENNIGVHFVAGGDRAELVRDGRVLHSFSVGKSCDKGMYVDKRKQNKKSKSVSRDDPAYHWRRALKVFQMHLGEEEKEESESERMHVESVYSNRSDVDEKHPKKLAKKAKRKRKKKRKVADEAITNTNKECVQTSEAQDIRGGATGQKNISWADPLSSAKEAGEQVKAEADEVELKHEWAEPAEQRRDEAEGLKAQGGEAVKAKSKLEARLAEFKQARTAKDKREFAEKIHARIHNGNTNATLKFLRRAFGDEFTAYMNDVLEESCDGCAFAKSFEKHPHNESTRKAKCIGDRLHFDVFTAPWRSDTGCKYLLVVIDEYSSYIWGFGMRKKSETMLHMKRLIMKLEKRSRRKVKYVESSLDGERELVINTNGSVSALRCDNVGENILELMQKWCKNRGIEIETSVPETPYQNGRAERAGGAVWKGGAAFRHAMNMPDDDWLHCIRAYIHVRNRLPNTSAVFEHTPYEEMFDVKIEPAQLISHFRTIGSLCYVHKPKSQQKGKPKKSYRAMMLGYSLDGAQKGYLVRHLSTGKLQMVPYGRLYKCFESENVYPKPDEYDEWLLKKVRSENRARGSKGKRRELARENENQSDSDDDSSEDVDEREEILDPPSGILDVDDCDENDHDDNENENEDCDSREEEPSMQEDQEYDDREALGLPIVESSPRMRTRRQLLPTLTEQMSLMKN
jgi:hypothetical protein